METTCFNPRELSLEDSSSFFIELDAHSPGFESGSHLQLFSQEFGGKPSPDSSLPSTNFFDITPLTTLYSDSLHNAESTEILPELSHYSEGDTESSPPDTIKVESPVDPALTSKAKSPARARPTRGSARATRPSAKAKAAKGTAMVASLAPEPRPPAELQSQRTESEGSKIEKSTKEKPASRRRPKRAAAEPADEEVEHEDVEEDTREKFLKRNRVAASKCRQKKKAYVDTMQEDLRQLEEKHKRLQAEHNALSAERALLKNVVKEHYGCNDPNIQTWVRREAAQFATTGHTMPEPLMEEGQQALSLEQRLSGPPPDASASLLEFGGPENRKVSYPYTPRDSIDSCMGTSPPVEEESAFNLDYMDDSLFAQPAPGDDRM